VKSLPVSYAVLPVFPIIVPTRINHQRGSLV
jgi:hypothetical protein